MNGRLSVHLDALRVHQVVGARFRRLVVGVQQLQATAVDVQATPFALHRVELELLLLQAAGLLQVVDATLNLLLLQVRSITVLTLGVVDQWILGRISRHDVERELFTGYWLLTCVYVSESGLALTSTTSFVPWRMLGIRFVGCGSWHFLRDLALSKDCHVSSRLKHFVIGQLDMAFLDDVLVSLSGLFL